MLAIALAALLIAPVSGTADPTDQARHLLAGCKAGQLSDGVQFTCAGFLVSVTDHAVAPRIAAQVFIAGLEAAAHVKMSTSPSSLPVGGQTWQGVRLSGRRPNGTALMEGLLFANELKGGRSRVVTCAWPTAAPAPASYCPEILTALAISGPSSFVPASAGPMFLGKPVPVPDGCSVLSSSDSSFRIACSESAGLMVTKGGATDGPERLNEMFREQLMRSFPDAAEEPRRRCRVDDVETTCQVIALGKGPGRALVFLTGAILRGVPVAIGCQQKANLSGVHPVCASLVKF